MSDLRCSHVVEHPAYTPNPGRCHLPAGHGAACAPVPFDESTGACIETHEGVMWGAFDANGYEADPIATFRDQASAQRWIEWQSRDEEHGIGVEWCVMRCDHLMTICNTFEDVTPRRVRAAGEAAQ